MKKDHEYISVFFYELYLNVLLAFETLRLKFHFRHLKDYSGCKM